MSTFLDSRRITATHLCKERFVILVLANWLKSDRQAMHEFELAAIQSATNTRVLDKQIATITKAVAELRSQLGVKLSQQELIELGDHIMRSTKNIHMCFVPYVQLAKWLSLYDSLNLQPHCRVGIDVHGLGPDYPEFLELRLLEATFYEDMCALFNAARESDIQRQKRQLAKPELKASVAIYRATLSATFYFVECYLNSLATGYLLAKGSASLKEGDLEFLTEWNYAAKRPKFVSTRDKLLQYPRILTGAPHPPLQESNCHELKLFVNKAKVLRDAIVHASPAPDLHTSVPEKEHAIFSLRFEDVEEIVDAAIVLVHKIEAAVFGDTKRIPWLKERQPKSPFPDDVFE